MNIIRELRSFFPKIIKPLYRRRSANYLKVDDMDGIKTMKDLGYTFNSSKYQYTFFNSSDLR